MTDLALIRLPSLCEQIDVTRNTIYDRLNSDSPRYDPTFPKPINIGAHSVAWVQAEVTAWIQSKIDTRDTIQADTVKRQVESDKRKDRAARTKNKSVQGAK